MSRQPPPAGNPQGEAGRRAGLRRTVRPRAANDTHLDLAGNDYLGLTRDKRVAGAAAAAALRWGAGSTGSRLVTGATELHTELEHELARFMGAQAALVFATGYADSVIIPRAFAHIPTVRKPYDAENLTAALAQVLKNDA